MILDCSWSLLYIYYISYVQSSIYIYSYLISAGLLSCIIDCIIIIHDFYWIINTPVGVSGFNILASIGSVSDCNDKSYIVHAETLWKRLVTMHTCKTSRDRSVVTSLLLWSQEWVFLV